MASDTDEPCARCGAQAESGFVRWHDGYALRWQPGEGEQRWRRREVLVDSRWWGMPVRKVAAYRCMSCRLVWFAF